MSWHSLSDLPLKKQSVHARSQGCSKSLFISEYVEILHDEGTAATIATKTKETDETETKVEFHAITYAVLYNVIILCVSFLW